VDSGATFSQFLVHSDIAALPVDCDLIRTADGGDWSILIGADIRFGYIGWPYVQWSIGHEVHAAPRERMASVPGDVRRARSAARRPCSSNGRGRIVRHVG